MDDLKRKKLLSALGIGLFVAALAVAAALLWKPLVVFFSEPQNLRNWVERNALWSRLGFMLLTAIQVIVAVIPGEPFEIAAGYAFGALEGTLLSMGGIVLGSIAVFLFVRKFGLRAVRVFFPQEKIDKLRFLRDQKRLTRIAFLLFLIPGTPKDIMTYCVGLTNMKLSTWMVICTLARIPSILTSTLGGDALGTKNLWGAAAIFIATALLSLGGLWLYSRINRTSDPKEGSS